MAPPVDVIIPFRSMDDGKRRLRPLLEPRQRSALNAWFLTHTLAAALQLTGPARVWLVTPCEQARRVARAHGVRLIDEPVESGEASTPESRLNHALSHALAMARQGGAGDVLIVSVDLPWLRSADLRSLCRLSREDPASAPSCVIATDRTLQGTNALLIPAGRNMDFAYGAGSCQRHADNARRQGMSVRTVCLPNLARDIDTPQDYSHWVGEGRAARRRDPADWTGGEPWMHSTNGSITIPLWMDFAA